MLDIGLEKGILEKSGTWLSFGGERLGQGRETARVFLKENKDIAERLELGVRKALGIATGPQAEIEPPKSAAAAGGHPAIAAKPRAVR